MLCNIVGRGDLLIIKKVYIYIYNKKYNKKFCLFLYNIDM